MARASPSGEQEPPWQPTPSPLARIAEARSRDRRSSARPPKRHQPADRLIAASGVNQLRSITRDENGRPGHPTPALRARDEHLVRDTEAPELRGRQGAAATHRTASVAYAVTALRLDGLKVRRSAIELAPRDARSPASVTARSVPTPADRC